MCDMASSTWYMNGMIHTHMIKYVWIDWFCLCFRQELRGQHLRIPEDMWHELFFRGVSESKHAHHERNIKKNCQMPNMPSLCHVGRSWGNTSWAERTCLHCVINDQCSSQGGVPFWHFSFGEEILWGAAAQRKNC
jgi:hypothetical protein